MPWSEMVKLSGSEKKLLDKLKRGATVLVLRSKPREYNAAERLLGRGYANRAGSAEVLSSDPRISSLSSGLRLRITASGYAVAMSATEAPEQKAA